MLTFLARPGGPPVLSSPDYDKLNDLFPDPDGVSRAVPVAGDDVPEPYRGLLVHTHHMTVTVERFYGSAVDVRVLNSHRSGNEYARKILLTLKNDPRRVVQFGLVRINLGVCPEPVRHAIVEGKTPLGRVLIQHDMLRRIEPVAFLRVALSAEMLPGTVAGWVPAIPSDPCAASIAASRVCCLTPCTCRETPDYPLWPEYPNQLDNRAFHLPYS